MNRHQDSLAATLGSTILRDVTLRDGLQLTGKLLPTERKVETVRELLRLGVPAIELGSMARADLVPTMANTLEVVQALTPEELEKCWIWVATPGHVAKAAAAGARNFQYCLSASDSHNKANIGRTTEESLAALPEAVAYAQAVGGQIQLCIATSFTCPFEGYGAGGACPVHRQRPPRRGHHGHRPLRHPGAGHPGPGLRADCPGPGRIPGPADRLPRPRHLGPGRGQHPRRHPGRRRHGGRRPRRPGRLPLCPGRQRQHLQRGHPFRHAARMADHGNLRRSWWSFPRNCLPNWANPTAPELPRAPGPTPQPSTGSSRQTAPLPHPAPQEANKRGQQFPGHHRHSGSRAATAVRRRPGHRAARTARLRGPGGAVRLRRFRRRPHPAARRHRRPAPGRRPPEGRVQLRRRVQQHRRRRRHPARHPGGATPPAS